MERLSDVVPGMGPSTTGKLYAKFGDLASIQNADEDDVLDVSRFLKPESVKTLRGV
ncbi:hypothetical protein [Halorubrum vacuolatum]|uniref:DisA/LigA helix-hairpin-helix motif domain-containing protein n=1 Tax=Halorubrum vacuolatum TaxID=63740 RepID=A0A238YGZ5_HALVU|nr:hypothetical protein [Halorubrum vacuolatum]SNR70068.1 hypothetical protein SAMN06264855_14214 [Halorubrum vacuolatum]